jgi:hypothetical protein
MKDAFVVLEVRSLNTLMKMGI